MAGCSISRENRGRLSEIIPVTTRCIQTRHVTDRPKRRIQQVVQMPEAPTRVPKTIGKTKPPRPPITPTSPPTTPTSAGK
jgi:hypothetical protein